MKLLFQNGYRQRYQLKPGGSLHMLLWALLSVGLIFSSLHSQTPSPLTTLQYTILGTQLQTTPAVLSVPKGIAGSVLVRLANADGSTNGVPQVVAEGAHVEAVLRGPSFEARRLVGPVNQALLLPPLNLVGDYQLDNIKLVDSATGAVRMEGVPNSVPVMVFDEVLVSRVTSRPLTYDEIKEKGIVIDERNFRAVEFEVGFVLDGKTIPVKFPVVAPRFEQSTEIIPQAELEAKLAAAQAINREINLGASLPEELQVARLNIEVQGINFQRVEVGDQDLTLQVPPIPALMVIPGNIGFLNQFFSVQIYTENAAPGGSGLSAFNIQAELLLPPGPDRILGTYDSPGDDPLRFARVGPNKIIQNIQPVAQPGADGKAGTSDDIGRLHPGDTGQGEFLVEGLQEGLHVMDLKLTADLDGLAAGTVQIEGRAAGSVLVRNPRFSMAFTHPRTVRAGEPYEASVTILNTSITPANLVSVTLPSTALSGGVLESAETVELGTILPGQTATANYRVRAQRTGSISFSNLTTGDDSVQGRFRLRMGIDERGVALSPDTIGMPDFVNSLPTNLLAAANRVLGQGLSVATAAQLPPGVRHVTRSIITTRVLELAEAGQRLRYGDTLSRVLVDLMLDWQGGRVFQDGFDQILRETNAGAEFRAALMREIELADALDATLRLVGQAEDIAGRGEAWVLASVDAASGEVSLEDTNRSAVAIRSAIPGALVYGGDRGQVLAALATTNGRVTWRFSNAVARAEIAAVLFGTNGSAQQHRWTLLNPTPGVCYSFDSANPDGQLAVDQNCDQTTDSFLAAAISAVQEKPPELVSVRQDPTVKAGRPSPSCVNAELENYGTILAVLFSKPMTQDKANVPGAYRLDNGNMAGSVQIQPGGRVALLNMRLPVSAIRPRTLTATDLTDPRGNVIVSSSLPVISGVNQGVALHGRVARADGSPAIGIPVTLTMYDQRLSEGFDASCQSFIVRVCQVTTDNTGGFDIDFVLSGIPYSVSATDTGNLSAEATQIILDSASEDALARDKLLELANSPSVRNTLLGAFAVGGLPEAIAAAEGLDRALLRDLVPIGSAREGTVTPVALRFRGRATVIGQVLAADGTTPVPAAAVNLFPDPDSRELGRGIFSDNDGRFAFQGVPLGIFSVQASSAGLSRTVSGSLEVPGGGTNIAVILSAAIEPRGDARGRVVEVDGVTGHERAQVFIGTYKTQDGRFGNVVAIATADTDGYWSVTNIPARLYDIVAISVDGRRKGERREITVAADAPVQVSIALQGTATVVGRVETSIGVAVPNALVAGGETIVRTDASGAFRLTGVPSGPRNISAGVERNSAAGFDFPRLGSASLNVVAGLENFVVVRLNPAGRIVGRVLDAAGNPVPNTRVAIPQGEGFLWVDGDGQGNYKFENLGLGSYKLSAPAPAAANTDVSGLLSTLRSSGEEEAIQAAIGEAFAIFTGQNDPFLTGESERFNPLTWGFTEANIQFDGQSVVADIRFLREGTVSGVVLNGQGVPIGARVLLTGIGPLANGMPSIVKRGEQNSDPALGTFEFSKQLLVGPWGLQAASPFYPVVITLGGQTTSIDPNATNLVLQFPATREVNGRLAGFVFYPDGALVGADVSVKISFGNDYVIRTDTNGFFDTQIAIPAGRYSVEATDPATQLRGIAGVEVAAGVTNYVNVQLLGKGSLEVTVLQGNGQPAAGALVDLEQGGYPGDRYPGNTADSLGKVRFDNIFVGPYAVCAQLVSGPTRIFGRAGVQVRMGETATVTVRLTPTGTIRGTFVQRDLVTPVGFAQVAVGNLGFAATDAAGRFEVGGVPLGTYRLVGQNPVTGQAALQTVTLNSEGEIREVVLVEQARGEIAGSVINSYNTGRVPGASVTLTVFDGITAARTVTTGPEGSFSFPSVPAGAFRLSAQDPVTQRSGSRNGTLLESTGRLEVDVPLESLAILSGVVYRPDGVTPAGNVSVRLLGPSSRTQDTDVQGRVTFNDLSLGGYRLEAYSLTLVESRNVGQTTLTLGAAGPAPDFAVVLRGVGSVEGLIFESDGVTPLPGAEVTLINDAPLVNGQTETLLADADGRYQFDNIAAGPYRLIAQAQALATRYNGNIAADGQHDQVNLTLGESGSVLGRLVRSDGATPVPGIDVLLTFTSQSGLPGRSFIRSDANGAFYFQNIPLGAFNLEAVASEFGGLARLTANLVVNGQELDLGDVRFDEDDPRVVSVDPAHTSVGISIFTRVELLFSEALKASSVVSSGIYLRSADGMVPATVALLDTNSVPRLVRITPNAPLRSQVTYEVVVIDGERRNAFGQVIGSGPTDLVGRATPVPFVSSFTTKDEDPPVLVSIFPTNTTVQVDPRAVMRLTFNEPIRDTEFTFTVNGPAGPVSGTTAVGLNGLALVFTPAAALDVNAAYTINVNGVRDLAGNLALNQPFVSTFATLDTLGPNIATLRIGDGQSPVAGGIVPIEALLEVNETGAVVRISQDFNPVGSDSTLPYRLNVTLPGEGTTTVRAIATDRYGNDGPLAELLITVRTNEPPVVQLRRGTPATGPLRNGQSFTLIVSSTDDLSVTNLTVASVGGFAAGTNLSSGLERSLTFTVPNSAVPGVPVQFRARATDGLGVNSVEATLDLEIIDGAAPTIAILSPEANASLDPNQPLELAARASDNHTNLHLRLILSGALSVTQSVSLVVTANSSITNIFTVSLAAAPRDGSTLTATVQATDDAGNSASAARSFVLPDSAAPRLVSITPADGTRDVSLWLEAVLVRFDEALDAGSISTTELVLTNNAELVTEYTVALDADPRLVRLMPTALPLRPGTIYTNILGPGFSDLSGNPWVDSDGNTVGAEGLHSIFVTASIAGTTPANGAPAVPGQLVAVTVNFEAGLGASFFRFTRQPDPPMDVPVAGGATSAAANFRIPVDANEARFAIAAHRTGMSPYLLPDLVLILRPRDADDDSDGWLNGFEADRGMNPFLADADSDDFDNDGLTNGQERALGTDPGNPDTDGDGLGDGQEYNIVGTDPLNPDTDGDTVPDGIDTEPIANQARPPAIDPLGTIEIVQGTPTNITVTARDPDANVLGLRVLNGNLATFYNLGYGLSQLSQANFNLAPAFWTNFTEINYPSSNGALWPNGPGDQFAIKFQTRFTATNDGDYTFYTTSDDGSDLYVDGQRIVNNDGLHGMSEASGLVTGLAAGEHTLEVRMFENGSGAGIIVQWAGPGFAKQLFRPAGYAPLLAYWNNTTNLLYQIADNASVLPAPLRLLSQTIGTTDVQLVAFDADTLTATQMVSVITLPDLDRDGVPDRDDADLDGDGLSNDEETVAGTDPANPDTDGDMIPDGADRFPLAANRRPIAGPKSASAGLQFDGNDDLVSLPNAVLNGATDVTVELWFKSSRTGTQTLLSGATAGNDNEFLIYLPSSTRIDFYTGAASGSFVGWDIPSIADGKWHHLALVRDDANDQVELFLDGISQGTRATALTALEIAAGGLVLGQEQDSVGGGFDPGQAFSGALDEVRIWRRILTGEQIRAYYNAPAASESGLEGYWRFDEGTGTTTTDVTADGHTGTLGGGTAAREPAWVAGLDHTAFQGVSGSVNQVLETLSGSDPDGDDITARVTALPRNGRLYQTADGVTRGDAITSIPATVSDSSFRVLYVPPRGVTVNDSFSYQVTDGYLDSGDAILTFRIAADPNADTDGDGMPDVFEAAHNLDPELDDAALDPDNDSLTNLAEFQRGTDPRNRDTDSDGLDDGAEIAANTNPLAPDTDGDGLPDGADPQPATVVAGLIFAAPAPVTLREGESATLEIQVESPDAPLVLLDYAPANPPPAFASLGGIQFTNTTTNGTVVAQLSLNPLDDAAGSYTISIRAAARDGKSGVVNISVTVTDDPALSVSRWRDPVSGNWTDASKWTAGVPGAGTIAVIDAAGSYTVTANAGIAVAGLVLNHPDATLFLAQSQTFNFPAEVRQGTVAISPNNYYTLTVNRPFHNSGTLRLVSRWYYSTLDGASWIENRGIIDTVVGVGGLNSDEARISLLIHVTTSGRLLMPVNGFALFRPGARLILAGALEAQTGARWRVESADPPIEALVLAGAQLAGSGTLQVDGSSQLVMIGNAQARLRLVLGTGTRANGFGELTLRGGQILQGIYDAPLRIAGDGVIDGYNATLNGNAVVEPGALLAINPNNYYTLTINGVLNNQGTLRMVSRWYYSTITGSGRIDNNGLIDTAVGVGGTNNDEARVHVPIDVNASGRFLVNANGFVLMRSGSALNLAGTLEVQTGARLRFENTSPTPDLTVLAGSQFLGSGVLRFDGSSRLLMNAAGHVPLQLEMNDSSAVAGNNQLTISGNRYLYGRYDAPLVIATGAVVDVYNTTLNGNVTVEPGALLAINPNNYYTLTINGVLDNQGTLRMVSRWYYSTITGSGRIENNGLIDTVVGVGGTNSDEARLHLPINVNADGRFLVNTSGFILMRSSSALNLAGTLEVQTGARLRFENTSPTPDLTVLAGNQFLGSGVLRFDGSSRLVMNTAGHVPLQLELNDSSAVAGSSRLTISGNRYMYGRYDAPLTVATGAVVDVYNTTLNGNVTVEAGALLAINPNNYYTLTINGVLDNQGTIRMVSRWYYSTITGSGRIDNNGLIDTVGGVGGTNSDEARVHLLVNVNAAGRFRVNTNGFILMRSGSALNLAGTLEIQTGGRLRFENVSPEIEFTLQTGGEIMGPGTAQVQGNNRLILEGAATLASGLLEMQGASQVAGAGKLTVNPGATWRFDHSANIDGSAEVAGTFEQTSSGVILRIDGTLTLQPTGTLTIPGTLSVGTFVNNGGTINGAVKEDSALVTTRWVNAANGNWNDAANWSAGVPDANKIAVIDVAGTYTVTVNASATIARLELGAPTGTQTLAMSSPTLTIINPSSVGANGVVNLAGGTLTGNFDLALDGALNWTGGTFSGSGITTVGAGGRLNISGANDRSLSRTIDNRGAIVWSGGRIFANNGAIINQAGATFEAQSDHAFFDGEFDNRGSFSKTAGAGTTILSNVSGSAARFHNRGTVTLGSGTLQLNGNGTHTGTFNLGASTVLRLNSGAHTLAGIQVTGAGEIQFSGAAASVTANSSVASDMTLSSGSIALAGFSLDVNNFSFSAGTVSGTGVLGVGGAMTWSGGTLGATTTIGNGSTWTISGTSDRTLNGTVNNGGAAVWSGGRIFANNGTVNNQAGATFEVQGDYAFFDGVFNNLGTFRKTAGAGTTPFTNVSASAARFHNSGAVELSSGTLQLRGTGTHSGSFTVNGGATLAFAASTHTFAGGQIIGAGAVQFSGAASTATGNYLIGAAAVISAGSLTVTSSTLTANDLTLNAGTLSGSGTVIIDGAMTWGGGTLGGTTTIGNGSTWTISGTNDRTFNGTVNNAGAAVWSGGRIFANNGTVNNQAGATFEVQGDYAFFDGVFNNLGTFRKTAGAGTTPFTNVSASAARFHNSGAVELSSGTLQLRGNGTHSGSFTVNGGATLAFAASTHTFAGGQIIGAGAVQFSGAASIVTGNYLIGAPAVISAGSMTVTSSTLTANDLTLNAGTLSGSGTVIIDGAMTWGGGTLGGTVTIGDSSTWTISGTSDRTLNGTVNNGGAAVWSGGRIFANNGTVNNQAGATFEVQGDYAFFDGVFNNAGTFRKTAGVGTTPFTNVSASAARFHNSGAVELSSGTLQLRGTGTHTGSFNLGAEATLSFAASTHTLDGATFSGTGTCRVQTPLSLLTDINFSTLSVIFESSSTVSGAFNIANAAGGNLTFSKTMTIPGSMTIAGTLTVGSASFTVTITGTLVLEATGVLDNPGTVRVGAFIDNGGTINGNAPVTASSPSLQSLRIRQITLSESAVVKQTVQRTDLPPEVNLEWSGPPDQQFTVEISENLVHWRDAEAHIEQINSGSYRARVRTANPAHAYFRLRGSK